MTTHLFFLECLNPGCGFRFPLDLSTFEGKICPRCGADLQKITPQTGQWQPKWNPVEGIQLFGVLDNIRSAHNVGSIFRTSEAAGVHHLYLCGLTPSPDTNTALSKAALGAEDRVADWLAGDPAVPVTGRIAVQLTSLDPEDLTLRQARLLGMADAVLFEAGVPLAVLNPARADAQRVEPVDQLLQADALADDAELALHIGLHPHLGARGDHRLPV